jgi:hypothetical protein
MSVDCFTADGVLIETGMQVWLYPHDGIIGGTIGLVQVGKVMAPYKFLYPEPINGYIGARAGSCYSTWEAADKERQEDIKRWGVLNTIEDEQ